MTVAEMMVSLSILGVVVAAVLGILASVQKGFEEQSNRTQNNDMARLAMEQLDREIRSANAFSVYAVSGSTWTGPQATGVNGTGLIIYTQASAPTRDPGFQCVQWRLSGTDLQSRMWPLSWQSDPSKVTGWRTVASDVVSVAFQIPSASSYGSRLVQTSVTVNSDPGANGTQNLTIQRRFTGRNVEFIPSNGTNVCTSTRPPGE